MFFISALVSSKIAAAVTIGALAVGGTAAAAYAGQLPAPLQHGAHVLLGAPDSDSETGTPTDVATGDPTDTPTDVPTETATPVGPDATGPAAFGLCTAYTHGGLNITSTAYQSLVLAAGSAENITAYCTTIPHPGKAAAHRPSGVTPGSGNSVHGNSGSHKPSYTPGAGNPHTPTAPETP